MSDLQRETLGSIARLADQLSYAAMNGHMATVRALLDSMKRKMEKLDGLH